MLYPSRRDPTAPDWIIQDGEWLPTGNFGGIPERELLVKDGEACLLLKEMSVEMIAYDIDADLTTKSDVSFSLVDCGPGLYSDSRQGWILTELLAH
jgi:hypothetical protein